MGPNSNDIYTLGSTSLRWADLYLGPDTLHIGSSTTDEGLISYNTTSNILKFDTDSTTNGDIAFFSDDLYLDKSTGNVGIGTTSPSQELDLVGDLELEMTTSDDTGVIYKGTNSFIHNFQHPTGDTAIPEGYNTFVGLNAGNFTMGSTATSTYQASYNSAVGAYALYSNTSGYYNSAVGLMPSMPTPLATTTQHGFAALYSNTTGIHNQPWVSALGHHWQ